MAKGILIAAMNFSDVAEDEFHDWYDTEHIPERLAVPGFLNAERWLGINDPKDWSRSTISTLSGYCTARPIARSAAPTARPGQSG